MSNQRLISVFFNVVCLLKSSIFEKYVLTSKREKVQTLSYLWDGVCSIFSGAGKFCLAHGLRQLKRDVKSDVKTLNLRNDVTDSLPRKPPNRMAFVYSRYAT